VETIGLAGASVLATRRRRRPHPDGRRFLGILALVAIVFGAIASNSMNDYTGSLAFQALGARVRRPIIAAVVAVLAFAAILWMNAGDTSGKFTNVLLFIGYWIAPFCAIVMIDWHYNKDKYTPHFLRTALNFGNLQNGRRARRLCRGLRVMVPFMNTTLITWHPVADALDGATGLLRRVCGRRGALLRAAQAGGQRRAGPGGRASGRGGGRGRDRPPEE